MTSLKFITGTLLSTHVEELITSFYEKVYKDNGNKFNWDFIFWEDIYEDNGNKVNNEDALTFENYRIINN